MRRLSPSTVLLFVAGLALFAGPLVAPAEEPPDRVEYRVDDVSGPVDSWETLQYETLSESVRSAFDAARTGERDTYHVSVPADGSLPPLADPERPVVAYDLEYEGQWYLLEVSRFDPEVPTEAHLVRLVSLAAGLLALVASAYRAVTA